MENTKFKVGDKVKIKEGLEVGRFYDHCEYTYAIDKAKNDGYIWTIERAFKGLCGDDVYELEGLFPNVSNDMLELAEEIMCVIDILNKVYKKEEGHFKFRVNGYSNEWVYNYGCLTSEHSSIDFLNYISDTYDLDDEIEIIEEKKADVLPDLEYIQFNIEQTVSDISRTMTYKSYTATYDDDTEILALVLNRAIKEINDLKARLDKENK